MQLRTALHLILDAFLALTANGEGAGEKLDLPVTPTITQDNIEASLITPAPTAPNFELLRQKGIVPPSSAGIQTVVTVGILLSRFCPQLRRVALLIQQVVVQKTLIADTSHRVLVDMPAGDVLWRRSHLGRLLQFRCFVLYLGYWLRR